uniref:Ig-like domain-containing protein n=1 Tax=Leptobrachium leishanense TaxID=445787 RepID=A0A8C5MCN0_9ANUR
NKGSLAMSLLYVLCLSTGDGLFKQKTSETAEVGTSVLLQCEVVGFNINSHHMAWLRRDPGEVTFIWLSAFRTGETTYIAEGFKGRITPSTSGSTSQLKIDNLSKSDSATYFCAIWEADRDRDQKRYSESTEMLVTF